MNGNQRLVRPNQHVEKHLFNPVEQGGGVDSGQGGDADKTTETQEDFNRRIKELESTLVEIWEYNEGGER